MSELYATLVAQYWTTPMMGGINYMFNVKLLIIMITFLSIVLAVLIAVNVWLMFHTAKSEKQRRRLLQERMDECDETIGEVMNKLGAAKQRLSEAKSANAALKRSFEETVKEYEEANELNKQLLEQNKELREKNVLLFPEDAVPKDVTMEEFCNWWKTEGYKIAKPKPVDHGEPSVHDTPGDPANKPLKPLKAKRTARKTKK